MPGHLQNWNRPEVVGRRLITRGTHGASIWAASWVLATRNDWSPKSLSEPTCVINQDCLFVSSSQHHASPICSTYSSLAHASFGLAAGLLVDRGQGHSREQGEQSPDDCRACRWTLASVQRPPAVVCCSAWPETWLQACDLLLHPGRGWWSAALVHVSEH